MADFAEPSMSWKRLAELLRERIASGEFSPGSRLPSGDRLAEELGANRNAVHRAVEDLARQGVVVRKKGSGTIVAERRTPALKRVALLTDYLAPQYNYPSGDLLRGLQEGLGERVHLVIAQSGGDYATELRQLENLSEEMDGIVVYPIARNECAPFYERMRERGYPLVTLDRRHTGTECDAVFTKDREAAHQGVEALIQRGHRRIGFLSYRRPYFQSVNERYQGYLAALAEAGLEFDEDDVRWLPAACGADVPALLQIVKDGLFATTRREVPITALFCVEDQLAMAALQAGSALGLDVPDSLEIATVGDWPPGSLPMPWNVHRIVPRKFDIGQAAARLLLDRAVDPSRPPQTVYVSADFFPMGAVLLEEPAELVD